MHIIGAKGNLTNFIYDGPLNVRPILIKEMQANGQWIHTCRDEFSYANVLRREGLVERGNLFIPPPVNDIIFAEGLYTILNNDLGLMLDQFEEETIEDPNCLATMSAIIRDFSKNNYSKKRIVRKKLDK